MSSTIAQSDLHTRSLQLGQEVQYELADCIGLMGHLAKCALRRDQSPAADTYGHIWNYELNTWGWEDAYGGGDHDYNDLVVNLDFTSAFGHGWLV